MDSIRKPSRWLLLFAVFTLLAAACGGGGDPGTGTSEPPADDTSEPAAEPTDDAEATEPETAGGGTFSTYIGEPESLFPTNTNETSGGEVLNALFTGLVEYDAETSDPSWGDDSSRSLAQSIESKDQTNWTIKLKEGWTFHNGDPVTAQDFVDTWNFGAYQPNAQGNSYFFANIEGYADLQCAPEDLYGEENPEKAGQCKPNAAPPPSKEMSGLKVVDDTTFKVKLAGPFSQFPLTLGYTAFYPVPAEGLEDPEAYNEAPIGTGPFMMDGEWAHDEGLNVVRYEDYAGEPAKAEGVEFRIYAEVDTAYTDFVDGNLDVIEDIPAAQIESARAELGDRFIESESSSWTYLGFPLYMEEFQDVNIRRAFSMAIDREAITRTIRTDSVPADAFISPVVAGYEPGLCGANCEYNPEEAKKLFDEAGGFDGTLTLWFNSGADHDAWVEAVSNQLRQNLGIEDIKFKSLDFAKYLELLDAGEVDGPFRLGWVMDYPSPQNYLEPIFSSIGSTNSFKYNNKEFDNLIKEGNQAPTIEDGLDSYMAAHEILVEDMPAIPMFFSKVVAGYSERVEGVVIDPFTSLNTADITVVE